MRIIKPGKVQTVMIGTCGKCKCEVECDIDETNHVNDYRDGDFYSIKCPTERCGLIIYLQFKNENNS